MWKLEVVHGGSKQPSAVWAYVWAYIHIYIYMCVPRLRRSQRYEPVHSCMHIGVAMGYRIQGAGCRCKAS